MDFKALFNQLSLLLIPKLFVIIAMYLFLNYIWEKNNLKPLRIFRNITIIIIIRDILYTIFAISLADYSAKYQIMLIQAASDILIITLYRYWISSFTNRKPGFALTVINCIIFLFFLALIWTPFANVIPGDNIVRVYWIWLVTNIFFLIGQMFRVSEFNTEEPWIILNTRRILMWLNLLLVVLVYLLYGWVSPVLLHSIIIPLSYFIHIIVISRHNTAIDQKKQYELEFVKKDIDSLFEFIQVLCNAIAEKLSLDQILKFIITSTVKSTGADAGTILMIDDYEDILKVKAVAGFFPPLYAVPPKVKEKISSLEAYFQSTPIKIGDSVLGEAVSRGEAIFIKNTFNDPRMNANTQNDTLFVSSLIVMPLVVAKRVLGVLTIINRKKDKLFSESDFSHLKTFAEYASLTIDFIMTYIELLEKKEMEREIGIAAEIQQQFLPKRLPKLKNAVLDAFSIPAKGVSGDYYDVLTLKGDKSALVICDVAGKGVPASLVMVMIRTILHLITASDRDVATLLTWVNRGISGHIDIDHYATMSIAFYNQVTNELTYANAAHHPLLIYRHKTQSTETMDTEGLPIGIEKTTRYVSKKTKLYSGDVIVMYTDGIIEAMNTKGEQYTTERFTELVANNALLSPKDIIKAIKNDVAAFVGNTKQHDDQTLLIMKVN